MLEKLLGHGKTPAKPRLVLDESAEKKSGRPRGVRDEMKRRRRPKIEVLEEKFLADLAKTDPLLFRKLMLRRLGIEEERSLSEQLAEVRQLAKDLGLKPRAGESTDDELRALVSDLGEILPSIAAILQTLRPAPAAPTAPNAQASGSTASAPPPPDPAGQLHLLLRPLESLAPAQAALGLRAAAGQNPTLATIFEILRQAEPTTEGVRAAAAAIGNQLPAALNIAHWLADPGRLEWAAGVIAALKQLESNSNARASAS